MTVTFALFLPAAWIVLLAIYAPWVTAHFVYHDQVYYFTGKFVPPAERRRRRHPQFRWLIEIGRPLAALMEDTITRWVERVEDLCWVRFGMITLQAIAAAAFAERLAVALDPLVAFAAATAIFTLPGIQGQYLPHTSIALLFSLLGGLAAERHPVVGFALLLSAHFIHPTFLLFLLPAAVRVLFEASPQEAVLTAARDVGLAALAGAVYVASAKAFIIPAVPSIAPSGYFGFGSPSTILPRLAALVRRAADLWDIHGRGYLALGVIAVVAAGLVARADLQAAASLAAWSILFLASFAVPVLSRMKGVFLRFLVLPSALIVLLLVWATAYGETTFQRLAVCLLALGGAVSAHRNVARDAFNAQMELSYMRGRLAAVLRPDLGLRLHVVPSRFDRSHLGDRSVSDELLRNPFGWPDDIPWLVSIARWQRPGAERFRLIYPARCDAPPPGEIHLTVGKEPPVSADVVIDMNDLDVGR